MTGPATTPTAGSGTTRRTSAQLERLRKHGQDCDTLERTLADARKKRDALALALVDAGCSWREVADAAGFENPYIASLQRKMLAGEVA